MAAMGFAGMARSYRSPKADRCDFLQFAVRQRSVVDGAAAPQLGDLANIRLDPVTMAWRVEAC